MTRHLTLALVIGAIAALAGCKQNQQQKPNHPSALATDAPRAAQATVDPDNVRAATMPAPVKKAEPVPDAQAKVSNAALPPFPYLAWPDQLAPGAGDEKNQDFDQAYMAIDGHFRAIEGRVNIREFRNSEAKLSQLAVERNYENALFALGAAKVYEARPDTREQEALLQDPMHGKLQYYPNESSRTYLLRTPEKKIWFSLHLGPDRSRVTVVDEVPMKQSVRLSAVQAAPPAGQ